MYPLHHHIVQVRGQREREKEKKREDKKKFREFKNTRRMYVFYLLSSRIPDVILHGPLPVMGKINTFPSMLY